MKNETSCPRDYCAVVVTAPADVEKFALDDLLTHAHAIMDELKNFAGHRVIFADQVRQADSSTVATLLELARRAYDHGCRFVICNPPKVLDGYLDIYLPGDDRSQCIFYTDRDDPAVCPVPWLPPFKPSANGRIDIWKNGQWHASYVWTHEGMRRG